MKSELNEKNQNLIYLLVDKLGSERSIKELLLLFMKKVEDPYNINALINSIHIDSESNNLTCMNYEDQYDALAARLDLGNYKSEQQIIDEAAYSAIDSIDQAGGQENKYDMMIVCSEGLISDRYTEDSLTKDLLQILEGTPQ